MVSEPVTRLVWIFLMETNNLDMEKKHRSSIPLKLEEETGGSQAWSLRYEDRVVQENHTRCGIEAAHGSRSDLKKVCGVKRGNTDLRRGNEELHQLVGKLKYLWRELDVLRSSTSDLEVIQERLEQDVVLSLLVSLNSSYGQLIMQVLKDEQETDQDQRWYKVLEGKIKETVKDLGHGECSYSAYMGSSVEESVVMMGQETKGADDPITKKEWDGFVNKHVRKHSQAFQKEFQPVH
ncbi:hypothetical protein F2Q70_00038826 [Brassica cretica]|uniref:Uncharacterized protein n=1 Tax=Brassica cretica TaxID=69181 RepID=A0A8S9KB04_BRACR|nr:hypothetical protein F2Q70_00038826 [Brassica cretica]